MSQDVDAITDKLKARQLRLTRPRLNILEVLVGTGEHLAIEEIRDRASALGESVSFATVYRTMRLLVDEGIAVALRFEDGSTRYECVDEGEHHDHLICTRCGAVTEFTDDEIERLQRQAAMAHGYSMTGHRLEIYGQCKRCRIG